MDYLQIHMKNTADFAHITYAKPNIYLKKIWAKHKHQFWCRIYAEQRTHPRRQTNTKRDYLDSLLLYSNLNVCSNARTENFSLSDVLLPLLPFCANLANILVFNFIFRSFTWLKPYRLIHLLGILHRKMEFRNKLPTMFYKWPDFGWKN